MLLNLTTAQFTSIFTSPMVPAIFLSLVAGVMADRFGIKRVVGIGFVITAIGAVWRIWSGSYSVLFTSMLLTGFGVTFLNANSAKIIGSWFPPEKIGGMMGIYLAASTVGMTIGTGTTAMLPGISTAYLLAAVLSVVTVLLWFLLMKNPAHVGDGVVPAQSVPAADSLKVVLKHRMVWIVGFCLMFILGCNVVIGSFLPTALGQKGMDAVTAGIYSAAYTIGGLVGCLVSPVLTGKIGKTKPVMLAFAAVTAAGAAFGWLAPAGIALGACLCVTGITIGGLMPLFMSIPIQLPEIGPAYAGTAGGVTATLQLLGAVVIPSYIIAPIAEKNMNLLFILGGVCMVIVFLLSMALPEFGKRKNSGILSDGSGQLNNFERKVQ